jgi:hypothetical protein
MNTFDSALECMDGVRKGFTDARMRHDVAADLEARRRMMLVQMARIEETVQKFEHAAMKGTGMRPKVEIPQLAYHHWAAKFKMRDMDAGITNTTGYECWQEGSGFYEWWVKNNERLRYREAKKCQQSSIIMPATKYTDVRKAAA